MQVLEVLNLAVFRTHFILLLELSEHLLRVRIHVVHLLLVGSLLFALPESFALVFRLIGAF